MAVSPTHCAAGVPFDSHRRCAACTILMGCPGEAAPHHLDPRLCQRCYREGAHVVITTRTRKGKQP